MNNKQCAYELCGELIPSKGKKKNNKYCSSICSGNDKNYRKVQSWINGEWDGSTTAYGELSLTIKAFLVEEAGFKCTECGWDKINTTTGKCPLEVDHIDGDSTNNLRENLKVLCRNCHALTPNFKALNQDGRGRRAWRKKYNQFDLVEPKPVDLSRRTCKCGKKKDPSAKQCIDCNKQMIAEKVTQSYPPLDEIVLGVKKLGFLGYSKTIGKSDNGLRGHLIRNGVDVKSIKKN